jgi:hypothetical protein
MIPESKNSPEISHDPITEVRTDLDRLRGRLFELVEACGFPPSQAEAAKRLIRRSTYDTQGSLESILRGGR